MIITNNNSVSQVSAGELELINMTVALSSEEITYVHVCDNTGRVFTFHRRRLCIFDGLVSERVPLGGHFGWPHKLHPLASLC